MKIRITKPGLYGNGPIPVGAEFIVRSGAAPAGWAGKYEVIKDDPAPRAQPVTAPATVSAMPVPLSRAEIIAKLDEAGWDGDKRQTTAALAEALDELTGK